MLFRRVTANTSDEEWAPISDLMAVLMFIFMFIAIVYIGAIVLKEKDYKERCKAIFNVLENQFSEDFVFWDAKLEEDLTIRFENPEVLFEAGSDTIRPRFQDILRNFFPRYLQIVSPYKEDIREIRIEGHTSSEYGELLSEEAYLKNMQLSQERTLRILIFALDETNINPSDYKWARDKITANGLSSSKLVYLQNDTEIKQEDKTASRRVEFRLVSLACQRAGVYEAKVENEI